MIAALLAQKLPAFEAAQLGVFIHGVAGDIARDQNGETGLIAGDIVDALAGRLCAHDARCRAGLSARMSQCASGFEIGLNVRRVIRSYSKKLSTNGLCREGDVA